MVITCARGVNAAAIREPARKRVLDWAAPGALLLLLFAGYFKANPLLSWVPVDLTFLGAALVAAGIATRIAMTGWLPRGVLPVAAVWAAFVPGAVFHARDDYGDSKTLYLFTLTLLATLGPLFLARSRKRQEAWVILQIALGCVLATGAWLTPPPVLPPGDVYRLALDGSNAIGAGRAAGMAVAGCLVLALAGHRRRVPLAVLGAALAVPMFLSGSRGPVLAAAAAVAVTAALAPAGGTRRSGRVALVVLGGTAAWAALSGATAGAVGRISSTLLAGSDAGKSAQVRVLLWRYTWDYITGHPCGTGWGGLRGIAGFRLLSGDGLLYPHNLLLEVTGEGGWLAGIAVLTFVLLSLRRLRRGAAEPYGAALFGIAVFFLMNAMVSGDVNDNRAMWAALAIGWVVSAPGGDDARQGSPRDVATSIHEPISCSSL